LKTNKKRVSGAMVSVVPPIAPYFDLLPSLATASPLKKKEIIKKIIKIIIKELFCSYFVACLSPESVIQCQSYTPLGGIGPPGLF
jgi:hypothetical protein